MARQSKCLLIGRPCPENANPKKGDYCPKWWDQTWKTPGGEVKIETGCSEVILPKFLTQLHHVTEHAAREASDLKNDARGIIERKLDDALAAMPAFVRQCVQRVWVPETIGRKVISIEDSRSKI